MKKQLTIIAFSVLMLAAGSNAMAQGKSGKEKEKQNQGKNDDKAVKKEHSPKSVEMQGAGNNQNDKANKGQNQGNKGNQDNQGNRGNNGKNDNRDKNDNGNSGRNDEVMRGQNEKGDGYKWDRETFKDRKKIKNQDKVAICHKPDNNNEPGVNIKVSANAVKAHMNHGDAMGECPKIADNRFSNVWLDKRTTYYTQLEDTREQVVYSRSILDYAKERLAGSRQQLVVMQANNVPPAEIQRKQVVVTELEQNVTLLEALVGAAANLLVNKLQN